jgi:hypothetical protein
MFWRYRAKDPAAARGGVGRAEARADDGQALGLVASPTVTSWRGARSVARWINRLELADDPRLDDRPVWAIVCFVVGEGAIQSDGP